MTQQHINRGTPPAGTDGDTNAAAWGKAEANFTELYGATAILSKGYISGLKMVWVSGTALTVTSGAASRPSDGALLTAASDIAKTGLSLSASTWYHVYLFDNAGTADVEIVTTAPAAPYNGTARAKTGDTTRRYLGSVKTDASGSIYAFMQSGLRVNYLVTADNVPFRVLNAGNATSLTAVSLSAIVPVTSRSAQIRAQNKDTGVPVRLSNSLVASGTIMPVPAGNSLSVDFPLDAAQTLQYMYPMPPTDVTFIDVLGYTYER